MKLNRIAIAALIAAALPCVPALAQPPAAHAHAGAELASMQLEQDPFAPVYIVTSRNTYDGIREIAREGVAKRDSLGNALVVSQIKAHQLSRVSEHIHQREKRCGGYFAFKTRAEADAFIRSDRSAEIARKSLVAYTIDNQATVNPWLPGVSATNIYNTIKHLQSYQNRYYSSSTGKTSAEWIRSTWKGLAGSRTDVTTELSGCSNCSTQPSVILTIQGAEIPGEIVVIGAHLDSINGSSGGSSTQRAPGADDDASGIATMTEVIRIALASNWKPKRTVKFMGYAAEEVGLRGSNAIAQAFKSGNKNVVGVLQMDMTNYRLSGGRDMRLVTDYSNASLKTFVTSLFDAYLAPLGMTRGTSTCGYACSDHASWTSAGYPSAMFGEGGDASGRHNPNLHTVNDTLAKMGDTAQPSAAFAKLGLAFLGELAKTSGGGGGTQTYKRTKDVPIPDAGAAVTSKATVAGRTGNAGSAVPVTINIVHPNIGDLTIDLVAPDGTAYNLHNKTGGSADNIKKTVNLNLSSEALNGAWRLRAQDGAASNTGKINAWSITF